MNRQETDFSDIFYRYHEQNPWCEWSYWITGKKIYTKDYLDQHINCVKIRDYAKTEIHHIFGRVSNDQANLINILKSPLHSRSHSHNSEYDPSLIIDYCLIKLAKGEMDIAFLKKHGKLSLSSEIRKRYLELKNNEFFSRACSTFVKKRINFNGHDVLEIFEQFEPKLEVIEGRMCKKTRCGTCQYFQRITNECQKATEYINATLERQSNVYTKFVCDKTDPLVGFEGEILVKAVVSSSTLTCSKYIRRDKKTRLDKSQFDSETSESV